MPNLVKVTKGSEISHKNTHKIPKMYCKYFARNIQMLHKTNYIDLIIYESFLNTINYSTVEKVCI